MDEINGSPLMFIVVFSDIFIEFKLGHMRFATIFFRKILSHAIMFKRDNFLIESNTNAIFH